MWITQGASGQEICIERQARNNRRPIVNRAESKKPVEQFQRAFSIRLENLLIVVRQFVNRDQLAEKIRFAVQTFAVFEFRPIFRRQR